MATPTVVITDLNGNTASVLELISPNVAHFHATDSTLGAGDWLNAKIEWDFGDPSGDYNVLRGFNAAHFYRTEPLSNTDYTVRCTITNVSGESAYAERTVRILPNTRTKIYVDPDTGSASPLDPSDPDDPYDTPANAYNGTAGDDLEFIFTSGKTHNFTVSFGDLGGRERLLLRSSGATPFLATIPTIGDMVGDGSGCGLLNCTIADSSRVSAGRIFDPRGASDLNPTINSWMVDVTNIEDPYVFPCTTSFNTGFFLQNVVSHDATPTQGGFLSGGDSLVLLGCEIQHGGPERPHRTSATHMLSWQTNYTHTTSAKDALTISAGEFHYVHGGVIHMGGSNVGKNMEISHSSSETDTPGPENIVIERVKCTREAIGIGFGTSGTNRGLTGLTIRNCIFINCQLWLSSTLSAGHPTTDVRVYHCTTILNIAGIRTYVYFSPQITQVSDLKYENSLMVGYNWVSGSKQTLLFEVPTASLSAVNHSVKNNVHPASNANADVDVAVGADQSLATFNTNYAPYAVGNIAKTVTLNGYRPTDVEDADLLKTPPSDMAQFAEDYYGNPRNNLWVVGAVDVVSTSRVLGISTSNGELFLSY